MFYSLCDSVVYEGGKTSSDTKNKGPFSFYNPGQNSWDPNTIARQIEASSLPPSPGAVLTLRSQDLIQHNQHRLGERGTAEIASYNNIPKLFQEVKCVFVPNFLKCPKTF